VGERIALASDAGLPGVNDPGARLIAAALDRGVQVRVLPGPSAVETALVASGLVGDRYTFLGYLPRTAAARERLWAELRGWSWPAVAFESPRRLPASLASLAAADPDRPVAVCRELSKRFEEVARGPARELADRFRRAPKGEITLVVGPGSPASDDGNGELVRALEAVGELTAAGLPRRRAVDVVAGLTGVPRNSLYRSSLPS
jgi:16S rRNA (cytidine1402-2'-O)-methyltransferase